MLLSTNKAVLSDSERFEAKKFGGFGVGRKYGYFKGLTGARVQLQCN